LAHDPELIVADEPTGNLDKTTEAKVLEILKSLAHDDGKCVIIVTHSKKVAAIADEILAMEKGALRSLPLHHVHETREMASTSRRKKRK
jgi:putative ABC transport system ATP-binding protein